MADKIADFDPHTDAKYKRLYSACQKRCSEAIGARFFFDELLRKGALKGDDIGLAKALLEQLDDIGQNAYDDLQNYLKTFDPTPTHES